MARRVGGEVHAHGASVPLLSASLEWGIRNFDRHRKQDGYDSSTWVSNVYLHFWQGAMEMASLVMGFYGHVAGEVWNPARQPFIDWRVEHPGEITWQFQPVVRPASEAERLFRLLLGREGPRPWVVKEVLRRLRDGS
ncbi:MAG: hypothetical protein AB1424_01695 [Thermodesulfobacteriota bacterium]